MKSLNAKILFNLGAFIFIVLAFENYFTGETFWIITEDIHYPLGLTAMAFIVAGRALDILDVVFDEPPIGLEDLQELGEALKREHTQLSSAERRKAND